MELDQSLQTVLLIDDDPNDRLLAIRELHREFPDLIIHEALNWEQIHQAFAADNFDLVITDYELNWTTGLEVLRAAKAHNPNRPVIMFTNSGTQEVAVEAMKAGLDDYVIKSPKHRVRLSQAVRTVWENAQIRRRATDLEVRLEFLLNELKVGVFRSTLSGELIEASEGLLQLLGLTSMTEAQSFFQTQLAHLATPQPDQASWHREVRLDGPADSPRWLQISGTLVKFNHQWVVDGLISDITERKATAARLRSLNTTLEQRVTERTKRLETLNKELEMFAFSVSHDLRSPIRQIDGFAALLAQHLQPQAADSTVEHYLQRIRELTDRAGTMIDDLLQFSRTGRAEMQYTTVSMMRLVQEVIKQVEPQLDGRVINWRIDPLPAVPGDRTLLRKVWQNLIDNAVKYTQQRNNAEIAIGSQTRDGEIIYFVRDNGIGFDMAEAANLFGVFQRLANAEPFDGTGIGLANVQRVIYRHQGRLWAEGTPDQGATFYFALPILAAHEDSGLRIK